MLKFEKLQGTGNDFIIFDGINQELPPYSELALKVCNRHFGIGADGMMVVEKSDTADIKMIFFNADGSQAPMCGNGIRCFSKYVYENKMINESKFTVETLGGIMKPEIILENNKFRGVKVNLGSSIFSCKDIGVNSIHENFIDKEIKVYEKTYRVSTLFIGTIHTVMFVDNLNEIDIEKIGPAIEKHALFPNKTNVNFCEIIDENNIKVTTWERGVGVTLACGTGCAASAIISSLLYKVNNKVNVHIKGGKLEIEQKNSEVFMTGPAKTICNGKYYYENQI